MNKRAVAIVLTLIFIVAGLYVVLSVPRDPLSEFRTPDGKLSIPGGRLTLELQKALFGPKPVPQTTYTVYKEVESGYPTIEIRGYIYDLPKVSPGLRNTLNLDVKSSDILRPIFDGLKYFFGLEWLFGKAAAADRFLVLGDGACTVTAIATDADCWSATSGGVGNAGVPGNTDRALLDAASGAGTGTMDAAMDVQEWCSADSCNGAAAAFAGTVSTGNFAVTIGTGGYTQAGTFNGGSSTITVSGNWNSSTGTFTAGTSTVVFAATANITTPPSDQVIYFNNLTVNDTVTVTALSSFKIGGTFNIVGTTSGGMSLGVVRITNNTLTAGANASISGSGTFYMGHVAGNFNVPGISYPNLTLGGFLTATATGNITVNGGLHVEGAGGGTTIFSANSRTVTVTGTLTLAATPNAGAVTFTTGAFDITGAVTVNAGAYIQLGSGSHTFRSVWTNSTTSASWDAGTGSISFRSSVGGVVNMTFAGTNLAEDEFNNAAFWSTAGGTTYTLVTRGLRLGGALTWNAFNGSVVLNTGANLPLTVGSVTISVSAALTANGSTITVSGNWTSSAGTFTFGTSTVVFAANAILTAVAAGSDALGNFYNIQINDTVTVTLAQNTGIRNKLTINGTTSGGVTGAFLIVIAGLLGSADPVSFGPNTAFGTVTLLDINLSAAVTYNLPVLTTYPGTRLTQYFSDGRFGLGGTTTFAGLTIRHWTGIREASLTTNNNTLTVNGDLTLTSVGANYAFIAAGSSTVAINGNVSLNANSYITFGSSVWTITGTWTNSSTIASWDAGSGTVTFTSATGGIMTFIGANLAEDEFNNVTFTSSAGTAQTFTMATRGLRFGGTLTIQDGTSTTALVTAGLAIDNFSSGTLIVGNGGILTASTSAVFVGNVQMTGGTSGIITITTGTWQLGAVGAFSWNTSGAGSTFTAGTGTVTVGNGSGTMTVNHLTGQGFYNFIVDTGTTATLLSNLEVANAATVSATGTLAAGTFDLQFVSLTITGSLSMDGFATSDDVTLSVSAGNIALTEWVAYTLTPPASTSIQWRFNPSNAGAVVTMTFGGLQPGGNYALSRDGAGIVSSQLADGTGSITFTVTSGWSPHLMAISVAGGGGGNPGGTAKGSINYVEIYELTFSFSITPPSDKTVESVTWNFGDGRSGTGVSVLHTYAKSGTYTITASVTYVGGSTEVISTVLTISPGPGLLQYIIAVLFYAGLLGAIILSNDKRKAFFMTMGLIGAAIMLLYFIPGSFPFFAPRIAVQGLLVLSAAGMFIYAFLPADKNKLRMRGYWIVSAIAALVIYILTFGGIIVFS